ncbi:RPAP2 phosphatase, partial [Horornis vulcanius]|nr:RPAP2 phosphatase [Horornis vulcanius]
KLPDIELLKEGWGGQSGEEVKLHDEVIKASDIENPKLCSDPCECGSHDIANDTTSDTEQGFISSLLPGSHQSSSANSALQLHRKSILKKKHAQKVHASPKTEDADVVEATEQLHHCKLDTQKEGHACSVHDEVTPPPSNNTAPRKLGASEIFENMCGSQIVFLCVSKRGAEHLKRAVANSREHKNPELRHQVNSKGSLVKLKEETEFLELRVKEFYKGRCILAEEAATQAQAGEEPSKDKDDQQEDLTFPLSENSLNYSLPFTGSGGIVKPVPSYEKLKEETEFLELRVKEFYKGRCILAEEAATQAQAGEEPSKDKDDQQEDLTFPLVDSNAQMQIRKRIVLEKLRK